METPNYIASLRLVGGNLALDFVNTVDGAPGIEAYEEGFECLKSYDDIVAWGVKSGALGEAAAEGLLEEAQRRPSEAEATHARALALRDLLYAIFSAVASGNEPSERDLEALGRDEREVLARAVLGKRDDGSYEWRWREDGDAGRPLWPVVHAAVGLLTSGPLDRLKSCVGCWWLFIDSSRNKSRRWCTMEDCGTHEKMRRYVARRAARRKGE
jgi:predicted RNA-binding Zn ribbon-like protein